MPVAFLRKWDGLWNLLYALSAVLLAAGTDKIFFEIKLSTGTETVLLTGLADWVGYSLRSQLQNSPRSGTEEDVLQSCAPFMGSNGQGKTIF
jgi:hypothetical protein